MASITYPAKSTGDTFTAAEANEVKTVVNGKADASHPHIVSDVSGLQALLDAKLAITGLLAALDAAVGQDSNAVLDTAAAQQAAIAAIATGHFLTKTAGGSIDGTGTAVISGEDTLKLQALLAGYTRATTAGPTEMRFLEDSDTGASGVALRAPSSIAADYAVTLPGAACTLGPTTLGAHNIWVPAGAMTPRTTSGAAAGTAETATNRVNYDYLAFDTGADEFAQFWVRMPKSWDAGTITATFVWTHPSTTTNFDVTWGIQAVAFGDGVASDSAFGTGITVTDAGGTTGNFYTSPTTAAVTIAGTPAAEKMVCFQVYRDVDGNGVAGNDDLAVDAHLVGVTLSLVTIAGTDD